MLMTRKSRPCADSMYHFRQNKRRKLTSASKERRRVTTAAATTIAAASATTITARFGAVEGLLHIQREHAAAQAPTSFAAVVGVCGGRICSAVPVPLCAAAGVVVVAGGYPQAHRRLVGSVGGGGGRVRRGVGSSLALILGDGDNPRGKKGVTSCSRVLQVVAGVFSSSGDERPDSRTTCSLHSASAAVVGCARRTGGQGWLGVTLLLMLHRGGRGC